MTVAQHNKTPKPQDLIQNLVDAAMDQPRPTPELIDALTTLVESYACGGQESGLAIAAALMGRKGGKRGGYARAASLTPERRREIARNAALTRWHGKR